MRLAGGVTAEDGRAVSGRLEVFLRGGWGTVCDQGESDYLEDYGQFITPAAAGVACAQLGFQRSFPRQPVVRPWSTVAPCMHACALRRVGVSLLADAPERAASLRTINHRVIESLASCFEPPVIQHRSSVASIPSVSVTCIPRVRHHGHQLCLASVSPLVVQN